jgi:predicted RND superfamily exporter protein
MRKSFLGSITAFSLDRPKTVIGLAIILTILFGIQFPRITIDTDPENMLEASQPDRVLYNRIKKDFGIYDLIVVGVGIVRTGGKSYIGDPQDQRGDH